MNIDKRLVTAVSKDLGIRLNLMLERSLIKSFICFCKSLVLVHRHFQGQPTSPPWTYFFLEKTPSETRTKPGAES